KSLGIQLSRLPIEDSNESTCTYSRTVSKESSNTVRITMERKQTSTARTLLSAAPSLIAAILAMLCVLAGARPNLLQDLYIIRAHRTSVTTVPGLGKVLGAALEELLQRGHIPEVIHLYAARYCNDYRLSNGLRTRECSSYSGLPSDTMAWLQVALTVLYAASAAAAFVATAMHTQFLARSVRNSRFRTSAMLWIALATSVLATLIVTVIVGVVHIVSAKSMPLAALHFETGSRYLIMTWAASIGLVLGLLTW
ncbi:hypothetical protein BKA63DRAFT_528548, partial [Paraphoma chrysanthemicola]